MFYTVCTNAGIIKVVDRRENEQFLNLNNWKGRFQIFEKYVQCVCKKQAKKKTKEH